MYSALEIVRFIKGLQYFGKRLGCRCNSISGRKRIEVTASFSGEKSGSTCVVQKVFKSAESKKQERVLQASSPFRVSRSHGGDLFARGEEMTRYLVPKENV